MSARKPTMIWTSQFDVAAYIPWIIVWTSQRWYKISKFDIAARIIFQESDRQEVIKSKSQSDTEEYQDPRREFNSANPRPPTLLPPLPIAIITSKRGPKRPSPFVPDQYPICIQNQVIVSSLRANLRLTLRHNPRSEHIDIDSTNQRSPNQSTITNQHCYVKTGTRKVIIFYDMLKGRVWRAVTSWRDLGWPGRALRRGAAENSLNLCDW